MHILTLMISLSYFSQNDWTTYFIAKRQSRLDTNYKTQCMYIVLSLNVTSNLQIVVPIITVRDREASRQRDRQRDGERDRPEIDIDDFSKQHRHIRERRRVLGRL